MKGLLTLLCALHLALAPLAGAAVPQDDAATVTSALLADVQTLIGDQGLAEGSAGHMLLHGLAGCAFNEASGADCVAGFAAGVVGSLYAGYLHENGIDPTDPAIGEHLNTAELLGAFAGFVFSSGQGENVSLGGQVAQSGVENNYLTHAQLEAFAEDLLACGTTASAAQEACLAGVVAHYRGLSDANNQELIEAIGKGDLKTIVEALMASGPETAALVEELMLKLGGTGQLADLFGETYDSTLYLDYNGSTLSYDRLAFWGVTEIVGQQYVNGEGGLTQLMALALHEFGPGAFTPNIVGLLAAGYTAVTLADGRTVVRDAQGRVYTNVEELPDSAWNFGGKLLREVDPSEANGGPGKPPYDPTKPIIDFEADGTTVYVRVYTEGETEPQGKWMMKADDIKGLTPEQIQDKFDLPFVPTHVTEVTPPPGTTIRTGTVNSGNFGGNGGGTQFELKVEIPGDAFGEGKPL